MKKLKNMHYKDTVKAFESFSKKHQIIDDYDMSCYVINDAIPLLTNNEQIMDVFYNIYRYGFMAGYKQNSHDVEKKHNKNFYGEHEEYHKKLAALSYYLPFGLHSEYFYRYMVFFLNHSAPEIANWLPIKQKRDFLKTLEEHNSNPESKEE